MSYFFDNMPDNLPPIINCIGLNGNICVNNRIVLLFVFAHLEFVGLMSGTASTQSEIGYYMLIYFSVAKR